MRTRHACALLAALLAGLANDPAVADTQIEEIEFTDAQGAAVTDTDGLSLLPAISREARFQTSSGQGGGVYGGIALWAVLEELDLLAEGSGHPELRQTIRITGSDGYQMILSVGEIAPDFGNTPVLIADEVDGKPMPEDEGPRLIVPGDTRGARNVRDVVRIEVR